jgi:hypothetical protein
VTEAALARKGAADPTDRKRSSTRSSPALRGSQADAFYTSGLGWTTA